MSLCVHYLGADSLKRILRDPAHGVALAHVLSPRLTFGELSSGTFCASEDKRAESARGLTLGKRGMWDTCQARFAPETVDLI